MDSDTDSLGGCWNDVSKNKSASLKNSERTALTALDAFVTELHRLRPEQHPHSSLATTTDEELENFASVFGRFPCYLMNTRKGKEGTAIDYICQARKLIGETCRTSDVLNVTWYKEVRKQTIKA
jgi:hypothetical protein